MGETILTADGVERAITDVGRGRPVVLLPAGGERRAVWDPVIAALAPAGYRCLAVDQRGRDVAFDTVVADAAAVRTRAGDRAVIVGASLGGFAALAMAAAEPDAVAGVVLVDVVPDPDPDTVRAYLGPLGLLGPLVDEILGRGDELRTALAGLDVPVRLVAGAASPVVGDGGLERFRTLAPDGDVVPVPCAGHLVARDRPLLLAGVLLDFLAGVPWPDETARDRAHRLLVARGAARIHHLEGSLLTHLAGTEARLRSWGVDEDIALAGLTHAVYSTDGFAPHLLDLTERSVLADAIGERAEDVVYRYAACDRGAVYPGLGREPLPFVDRFTGRTAELSGPDLRAFALVSAANELDLVDRRVVAPESVERIDRFVADLSSYAPEIPAG